MTFPRDDVGHATNNISPTARPAQSRIMENSLWWTDTSKRNRFLKEYRTQVSSGVSTIIATLISTPLENLKTRMQTHDFRGYGHCARYMWRTEGIRGYTAGALPPLASITIVRVINFTVYQKVKYFVSDTIEQATGTSPLVYYNTPGSMPTLGTLATFTIGGMAAGLAAAPLACPFELAKNVVQTSVLMANRAQASGTMLENSPLRDVKRLTTTQAIKQIISRHGIAGLYTGVRLHAIRDTIGTGMYFAIYETTKQLISTYQGDHGSPFGASMAAGALCGVIPWMCTYGLDTRKTRAQSILLGKSKEISEATIAAAKSSTYRGMTVLLCRTSVQNMILLSSFEYFKKQINELPVYDEKPVM